MEREINSYRNEYFEGLIAHYTENPNISCDYSTHYAIRAFYETSEYGLDTYIMQQTPFEQDMGEFMYLVENEAGIKEFYLCDCSTGLMGSLHYLLNASWEIIGLFEKEVSVFTTLRGLHMKKS